RAEPSESGHSLIGFGHRASTTLIEACGAAIADGANIWIDGGRVNGHYKYKDPIKYRLSSSFGGDSLDATTMNPLVSARFPAPRPAPETCALLRDVVRAYSAGHPWPTGDHLSQPPRSTTS